ncbi:MAG: signal peptidase I [Pseudanabaenaceae cyanobacterium SKYGB_i_bin29]|nr:signal peptidase I [Pseudanabaenaceae cyanobacterium SKYG29]MDW8421493.1 signal peptidase I [Pseudanabaenaceae cyanobacterium SKYGB_i_bin29]
MAEFSWKDWWQKQGESLRIILLSLVIAVLLRSFVIEPRYIPSGSMEPTLQVNDRIMVEKLTYHWRAPKRGEIIVFEPPFMAGKAYIKRVIGLPGEQVAIKDGKVFINGIPLEEPYILEPPRYEISPFVVPPGYYWVMGDNRNNSNDSHIWGFLPQENIQGRAILRFWPPNLRLGLITLPQYPHPNLNMEKQLIGIDY